MSNNIAINIGLSNLTPNEKYTFNFSGQGGNWPAIITPVSGVIQPNSETYQLKANVHFCDSLVSCSDEHLGYLPYNSGLCEKGSRAYTAVSVDIQSESSSFMLKDNLLVECDNCIPVITVSAPETVELSKINSARDTLSIDIAGVKANQTYTYVFESLFGNWPMYVAPISGQFVPTSDTYRIVTSVHPCYTNTNCNNTNLLNNYVLNKEDLKYSAAKLKLMSSGCSDDSAESSIISINCVDCLPDAPSLSNEDTILTGAGNNKTTVKTQITELDESTQYAYTVTNIDSNWPVSIYPLSGTISNKNIATVSTHIEFCNSINSCAGVSTVIQPLNNELCVSSSEDKRVSFEIAISDDTSNVYSAPPVSVECKSCLDKVSITAPEYSQISTTNSYTLNSVVSGLVPGDRYSYNLSLDHATWPVIVEKPSGTFVATSSSKVLSNKVSFCQSTGLCPNAVWSPADSYSQASHVELSLSVDPLDCDIDSVTSNSIKVECNGCIKKPTVLATQPSSPLTNTNRRNLSFTANNLIPGQTYNYVVKAAKSNWPIIVDNLSGVFVATATSKALTLSSTFCPTDSICDGNSEAIQPTDTTGDDCLVNSFNDNQLYANLYIELIPSYDTNEIISSNIIESVCLDCLPQIRVSSPNNVVIGSSNATTVNFLVSGLEKGHEYSYVFSDKNSNWPFTLANPSGSFVSNGTTHILPASVVFAPTIDGPTANARFNNNYQPVELYQDRPVIGLAVNVDSLDCAYASADSPTATITCNECLPKLVAQAQNVSLSNKVNSGNVSLLVGDLIPKHNYSYNVLNATSNWPVVVSPMSGTFVATGSSENLLSRVTFCPTSSGTCYDDNVASLSQIEQGSDKLMTLQFKVSPISQDVEPVLSNKATVFCNDCLPEITINSTNPVLTNSDTSDIVISIDGLLPYNTYNYAFVDTHTNWPVSLSSLSGTFYTTQSTHTINAVASFCATSNGVCSSGNNVLPFELPDACRVTDSKYASMRLKVWSPSVEIEEAISSEIIVTCNDCLRQMSVSNINGALLASTNVRTIPITVTNLEPNIEYEYVIESLESTWPIRHTNNSGVFVANSSTYTFNSYFEFCRTADGPCSSGENTTAPTKVADQCDWNTSDIYGKYRVMVQPTNCDLPTAYSNEFDVICNDCINTVKVGIPTEASLTETGENSYSLDISVSGLQPKQVYQYVIDSKDANWPIVATPRSGEFVAGTSTRNITSDLLFCYPSGMCGEDSDAFDFVEFTYLDKQTKGSQLRTKLEVSVMPVSCEGNTAKSNEMLLSCDNCLPAFSYASIRFSGSPELTLPDTCCSGIKTLSVNVIGAVPSDPYYYEFTSRNENIQFAPSSGIMYFDVSGSGSIMTLMDTNLSLFEHGVIQCNVKHMNTGFEAIDMIAIKCGNDCSAYYEGLVGQPST